MHSERRKHPRFPEKIQFLANLIEGKDNPQTSYTIPFVTENISKAGLMALWPKGWVCLDCKNCIFWAFNISCRLKNNTTSNGESNKVLPSGCLMTLRPRQLPAEKFSAQVIWAEPDTKSDLYRVGLHLSKQLPDSLF